MWGVIAAKRIDGNDRDVVTPAPRGLLQLDPGSLGAPARGDVEEPVTAKAHAGTPRTGSTPSS
jgi:hypothetical protein